MATGKPPIRLRGIRATIPTGHILGRMSTGHGDVELLRIDSTGKIIGGGAAGGGGGGGGGGGSGGGGPGGGGTVDDDTALWSAINTLRDELKRTSSLAQMVTTIDGGGDEITQVVPGPKGNDGTIGRDGAAGQMGPPGMDIEGDEGWRGPPGPKGDTGATGATGASGAGAVTSLMPTSIYTGGSAGNTFPNFYIPATNTNTAGALEGIGVVASLAADATVVMQFNMPPLIPSGTLKLRCLAMANATSGVAKLTIKDKNCAAGASLGTTTLNSETQVSQTWATADILVENLVTLATAPSANDIVTVLATFNTTGWTLTAQSTWQFSLVWY